MAFLDTILSAAEIPEAALIKFLTTYKFKASQYHFFFEGLEDSSFYNSHLKSFLPKDATVFEYICDGKPSLLQVFDDINWNKYKRERVLFFTDKDIDDYLGIKKEAQNLFVTKYYSVENYLVTSDVFKKFLTEFCKIRNQQTVQDLVSIFDAQLACFRKKMLCLTAWMIYCRKLDFKLNLNDVKLNKVFSIDNDLNLQLRVFPQYKSYQAFLTKMTKNTEDVDRGKILQIARDIHGKHEFYIRGKYDLWFMYFFCDKVIKCVLPEINKKITEWNKNNLDHLTKCKIFSITEDIFFEIFSTRTATPLELSEFYNLNIKPFSDS